MKLTEDYNNFVALDLETSNSDRSSICSIGLVKFENNTIVDTFYTLINPEVEFDYFNINLHGITPELVSDSPTFLEIRPDIINFIENFPVVCHFAQFDTGALRDANEKYGIANFEFDYFCTYLLSRSLLSRLSYKLSNLCSEFNIEFDHHNALEDAKASGLLLVKLCELSKVDGYQQLIQLAGYPILGHVNENGFNGFRKKFKRNAQTDILKQLKDVNLENVDPNNEFYDKNVVFTGTLSSMIRREAMQLIKNIGGFPQNRITTTTNYLVMGEQDLKIVGTSGKSSKIIKAESMLNDGKDIQLLGENDFIKLIQG